jgi:hypothetical protein
VVAKIFAFQDLKPFLGPRISNTVGDSLSGLANNRPCGKNKYVNRSFFNKEFL